MLMPSITTTQIRFVYSTKCYQKCTHSINSRQFSSLTGQSTQ